MNAAAQPVYQFRALKLSWSSGCQLWSNWLPATWQGLQPEMERGKKWLGIVGFTQDANSKLKVLVESLMVGPTLSFWPFLLIAKGYLLDGRPEPKVDIWQHGLRDFGQLFVPSLWPWADFWADWKVTITLLFGSKVFDSYMALSPHVFRSQPRNLLQHWLAGNLPQQFSRVILSVCTSPYLWMDAAEVQRGSGLWHYMYPIPCAAVFFQD